MGRAEDLIRAEARKLYAEAAKIKHGDERLVFILRAMELEAEADMLERQSIPPRDAPQHAAQQQQQPQPDDDDKE